MSIRKYTSNDALQEYILQIKNEIDTKSSINHSHTSVNGKSIVVSDTVPTVNDQNTITLLVDSAHASLPSSIVTTYQVSAQGAVYWARLPSILLGVTVTLATTDDGVPVSARYRFRNSSGVVIDWSYSTTYNLGDGIYAYSQMYVDVEYNSVITTIELVADMSTWNFAPDYAGTVQINGVVLDEHGDIDIGASYVSEDGEYTDGTHTDTAKPLGILNYVEYGSYDYFGAGDVPVELSTLGEETYLSQEVWQFNASFEDCAESSQSLNPATWSHTTLTSGRSEWEQYIQEPLPIGEFIVKNITYASSDIGTSKYYGVKYSFEDNQVFWYLFAVKVIDKPAELPSMRMTARFVDVGTKQTVTQIDTWDDSNLYYGEVVIQVPAALYQNAPSDRLDIYVVMDRNDRFGHYVEGFTMLPNSDIESLPSNIKRKFSSYYHDTDTLFEVTYTVYVPTNAGMPIDVEESDVFITTVVGYVNENGGYVGNTMLYTTTSLAIRSKTVYPSAVYNIIGIDVPTQLSLSRDVVSGGQYLRFHDIELTAIPVAGAGEDIRVVVLLDGYVVFDDEMSFDRQYNNAIMSDGYFSIYFTDDEFEHPPFTSSDINTTHMLDFYVIDSDGTAATASYLITIVA